MFRQRLKVSPVFVPQLLEDLRGVCRRETFHEGADQGLVGRLVSLQRNLAICKKYNLNTHRKNTSVY